MVGTEIKQDEKCLVLTLFLDANPDEDSVEKLNDYLKPENISEVEVETGNRAMAICGARASCGLISFRLKNEVDLEQLKALL